MLTSVLDFLSMIAGMVMACVAGLVLAGGFVLLKLLGLGLLVSGRVVGGYVCAWLGGGAAGWMGA